MLDGQKAWTTESWIQGLHDKYQVAQATTLTDMARKPYSGRNYDVAGACILLEHLGQASK